MPALLVLEDGLSFRGTSCGAEGETYGEICFNTSLVGYQEVISDPSYAGQIITMTYPQIGNYGVNRSDMQRSSLALRGLVVHDMCRHPSNFRSEESLPDLLVSEGIVAIEGIDTRKLTRHIRDRGAMRAAISTVDLDVASLLAKVRESGSIVGANLARTVSCHEPFVFDDSALSRPHIAGSASRAGTAMRAKEVTHRVVAYDFGAKRSILRGLYDVGCEVTVVPWDTSAEEVLNMHPDGVFLSNGPGDPAAVTEAISNVRKLLGKVPMFGICLGHQIISLAVGGNTMKLKFGHRGGNQPVMNLLTGCVEITAQNHGFNIDPCSLGHLMEGFAFMDTTDMREWVKLETAPIRELKDFGRVQLTHVNLNDGTAEGLRYLDIPAFSVQYHPEASPGPHDSLYLFEAFARLMDGIPDYLDIDIRSNRLGINPTADIVSGEAAAGTAAPDAGRGPLGGGCRGDADMNRREGGR